MWTQLKLSEWNSYIGPRYIGSLRTGAGLGCIN